MFAIRKLIYTIKKLYSYEFCSECKNFAKIKSKPAKINIYIDKTPIFCDYTCNLCKTHFIPQILKKKDIERVGLSDFIDVIKEIFNDICLEIRGEDNVGA